MSGSTSLGGRVLVLGDSVEESFLDRLREAGLEVRNPPGSFPPAILGEAELMRELEGCCACLLGGDEVATASVLESAAAELRVVSFLGVGYESYVDAAAAARLGIRVTSTPGVLSDSVAEFTVGLMLDGWRRITEYAVGGHDVPQVKRHDLRGHRVGVIGLGAIATRTCEILTRGFELDVRYFSRSRKPDLEQQLGIAFQPLAELVGEVDCLIVLVPETPATKGLVDREIFARRDPDSGMLLVNTSRADVVEPEALTWALDTGRVESAWFDGFYRVESATTHALEQRDDVAVTPHVASLTHEAREAMAERAVGSLLNVLRGGEDPYAVA
jgi:lactate dehydrogenase-like 2-hydroxyacid dehydrogenase